jgi:hypothetical protein
MHINTTHLNKLTHIDSWNKPTNFFGLLGKEKNKLCDKQSTFQKVQKWIFQVKAH